MLVSAVLNASARKIGVIASGETLTTAEYADALIALQGMLRSWAAEKINLFASTRESYVVQAGTGVYTWGIDDENVDGDIATARPNQIVSAYVVDGSGTSYQLDVISSAKYNAISDKTVTGTPLYLYPVYNFPLASIYLYPIPSSNDTLTLESIKPFNEEDSFLAITDILTVPLNYEEAIIYNLAVRLAPEFGISTAAEVVAIAKASYERLMILNASNFVDSVNIHIPAGRSSCSYIAGYR